ncbi:hypothetical protein U1Q18_021481 [Sarracenia purpurea var. burkii]
MEFLDEETRPRFLFQSRSRPPPPPESQTLDLRNPSLFISISLSILLFVFSLFFLQSEPLKSLVFWLALSFLLGPFAPSSLTAGDIRVGVGKILESPPPIDDVDRDDSKKKPPNRRSRPRKPDELGLMPTKTFSDNSEKVENSRQAEDFRQLSECEDGDRSATEGGEREWSEGDVELLKKLLVKHPVGKPKRWEAISDSFQGRHGLESVIKTAKSMGEKRMNDADSFSRFLKDRKPVDKRIEDESEALGGGGGAATAEGGGLTRENGVANWSAGDDIALLNALKAFPKDAPMRWEKIEAAVPGKSKAACVKRVAELKKGFRSSKACAAEA